MSEVTVTTALHPAFLAGTGIDTVRLPVALTEVNRHVANILGKEGMAVTVEFFHTPPMIQRAYDQRQGGWIAGVSAQAGGPPRPIAVEVRDNWRETFMHELVHLYSPDASEKKVKALTQEAIKFLKRNEELKVAAQTVREGPAA